MRLFIVDYRESIMNNSTHCVSVYYYIYIEKIEVLLVSLVVVVVVVAAVVVVVVVVVVGKVGKNLHHGIIQDD